MVRKEIVMLYAVVINYHDITDQPHQNMTRWYNTPDKAWREANRFLSNTQYTGNECTLVQKEQ